MLDKIKTLLEKALSPTVVVVTDQSHRHRHHAEAKKHGGGHFDVMIVSEKFNGQNTMARHRLVYAALKPLFDEGAIHALAIKKALTPHEEEAC